jgi:hypothetical protein
MHVDYDDLDVTLKFDKSKNKYVFGTDIPEYKNAVKDLEFDSEALARNTLRIWAKRRLLHGLTDLRSQEAIDFLRKCAKRYGRSK